MNAIGEAYVAACLAELDALKPGNVHRHAAGHGMTVAHFETGARASAPEIARAGASVGARILAAVTVSLAAVGQNANLGIVLLCAPLAAAAERAGPLRQNLADVLDALDLDDARAAFAAIVAANPGGLGRATDNDVRDAPAVGLREAMAGAAARDLIARQYDNAFADVFGLGLAAHARAGKGEEAEDVFLAFLAAHPDSHIARKFGAAAAEAVRRDAAARVAALTSPRHAALFAWDAELKAKGFNPGTCADLTVATIFAARLERLREERLLPSRIGD